MTCLLINEHIALDAGCLAQALPVERQRDIHSILITHSHIDHTNSLPFFIDNIYGMGDGRVHMYSSPATIYAVRKHLFNNTFWPDFARLPNNLLPAIRFHELVDEVPFEIGGVRFTPIPVNHVVPTYGFLIEEGSSAVLWSSDTGPTTRFWEIANQTPKLKAICIETSFDNSMQRIADASRHLTPMTLAGELCKLERRSPLFVHHLKPPCKDTVRQEVTALRHPDIGFLEQGQIYTF